jgi:transposase
VKTKIHAGPATAAMHDELRELCRVAGGRSPEPTAAVIDSQSVKAAEEVARTSRGFDAGKKINGRKRHIAVDVMGLLLVIVVTAASVQDRDGARALLWRLRSRFHTLTLVWADGGYAGKLLAWAQANLRLTVQIVKRNAAHAFVVLRRRWVVERTFAWITRSRRTVRDYERLSEHHAAMIYWSMIIIMTRQLACQQHGTGNGPPPTQLAPLRAA